MHYNFRSLFLTAGLTLAALSAVPATVADQASAPSATDQVHEASLEPFLGEPKLEMQQIFKDERFPNVVVAMDGTVIASWGRKVIRVRRSEDGGKTWGPQIELFRGESIHGGGTVVDEKTGDILAFAEAGHPPAPHMMFRSQDHGKTWKREGIVVHPDKNGNMPSLHMNESGITLRRGEHKGRLLRASRYYGKTNDRSEWPNHYTNAIYSDDGGKTWHTSDPFPENGTGEAAIEELADGTLYYNSRVHWGKAERNTRRRSAISTDGGETWKDWRIIDELPDGRQDRSYGLMGGLTRLPVEGKDILIFSNIDTPRPARERATVWASFDGGKTWPVKRLVNEGPSAYSSLVAGRPGTPSEGWIYLLYEGGPNGSQGGHIARFNLSWLLNGEEITNYLK